MPRLWTRHCTDAVDLPPSGPIADAAADAARFGDAHFMRLPFALTPPLPPTGDPAANGLGDAAPTPWDVDDDVFALLRGIDQLLQWNVDVINLSLGPVDRVLAADHPLAVAVRCARSSGVIVVVAAGNGGPAPDTLQALARLPGVIAVGATDAEGRLLATSSRGTADGEQPAVVACGVTDSLPGIPDQAPGTSFAAPKVAGLSMAVLRALQILRQDFADHLRGEWTSLGAPIRRPVVGIADTGVDPAALDSSSADAAAWQGGNSLQLSRGDRERQWLAGLHAGLANHGISCSLSVTPDTVRQALRHAARPMPGCAASEVGAGVLDDQAVLAWLSSFTPSRFVALFAARALTAAQLAAVAALDDELGSLWNDTVSRLILQLFRSGAQLAVARVI